MIGVTIDIIPHADQRYDTVGDWLFKKLYSSEYLTITVSDMNNPDYEFLVGIHELIEAYLCQKRGIKEEDVTAFDKQFEPYFLKDENNKVGGVDISEPGDDPKAPYYVEHQFATKIEMLVAEELGVDWEKYDKTILEL
jgi:hypothetical protein